NIRVAFEAGHEGGFADGSAQVSFAAISRNGVLADENLRPFAIVAVVAAGLLHEKFWRVVVVLVHDFRDRVARITALPMVGDEMHVRIFRPDGVDEQRPTLAVRSAAVFVADFEVLQMKRRGMAISRPPATPEGV